MSGYIYAPHQFNNIIHIKATIRLSLPNKLNINMAWKMYFTFQINGKACVNLIIYGLTLNCFYVFICWYYAWILWRNWNGSKAQMKNFFFSELINKLSTAAVSDRPATVHCVCPLKGENGKSRQERKNFDKNTHSLTNLNFHKWTRVAKVEPNRHSSQIDRHARRISASNNKYRFYRKWSFKWCT